jgi:hypothetical protein
MAENSSFRGGSAGNNTQNKPTESDSKRVDEYDKQYKDRADQFGEAEKFGTDQNPVHNDKLPASGLKGVGGSE